MFPDIRPSLRRLPFVLVFGGMELPDRYGTLSMIHYVVLQGKLLDNSFFFYD